MEEIYNYTPKRVVALDGLRGFSAIYVVIFHILHQPKYFESFGPLNQSIILAGASMVQVFFVVSGYSISKSIFELVSKSKFPKAVFLMNRFFRIYPLWAALLTLMFLQHQIEFKILLGNLLFFYGDMKPGSKMFPVFLSWSLQVEVIFYILAGLFMHNIFKIKKLSLFCVWVVAIYGAQLWRSFAYQHFPSSYLPDGFFLAQMMYFVAGIFIKKNARDDFFVDIKFSKMNLIVFELAFVICFLLFSYWDLNFLKIFLAPIFVILVLNKSSWLSRLMSTKALVYLGSFSYGIYLLQDISRAHVGIWFGNTLTLFQELFLSLGLTILIAVAAYFLIEKPALSICKFLSNQLKSAESR